MPASSDQKSSVKSAKRTLQVFELFDQTRRGMTLTEVADELAIPTSSTQELLRSLAALGYLNFDRRSRVYTPTLRVAVLGEWIEQSLFGQGHYKAMMQELRDKTGETVGIGCESDLDVQILQIWSGTYPLTLNMKAGDRISLCTSAMGRAVLSQRPKAYVDRLLRRHNSIAEHESERVSQSEMDDALAFVRKNGFAVSRTVTPHGLGSIGMLMPNTQSDKHIVLGVSGPAERINQHQDRIVNETVKGFRQYF